MPNGLLANSLRFNEWTKQLLFKKARTKGTVYAFVSTGGADGDTINAYQEAANSVLKVVAADTMAPPNPVIAVEALPKHLLDRTFPRRVEVDPTSLALAVAQFKKSGKLPPAPSTTPEDLPLVVPPSAATPVHPDKSNPPKNPNILPRHPSPDRPTTRQLRENADKEVGYAGERRDGRERERRSRKHTRHSSGSGSDTVGSRRDKHHGGRDGDGDRSKKGKKKKKKKHHRNRSKSQSRERRAKNARHKAHKHRSRSPSPTLVFSASPSPSPTRLPASRDPVPARRTTTTKKRDDSPIVEQATLYLTLLDPSTKQRINNPHRGIHCRHREALDKDIYEAQQAKLKKEKKGKCPICKQYIGPNDLVVDTKIKKLLRDSPNATVVKISGGTKEGLTEMPSKNISLGTVVVD
ncbi:hypothetical protein HK097_004965 [Rhizophlyctis rosea]|uniref:SP-RING-type domain-containing protein n=1 Tax=Rhizophlyctis rosea TaxID=64517 RepID=A0AAD5SH25_9FUNG|nr:hypothetical protein HK097_004965 [Rhizophlyctis rosea]